MRLISIDRSKVVAIVSGSEPYRVELGGNGKTWEGGCSCPASEGELFCKHMVAVALAAGSSTGSPDAADQMTQLRDHLAQMDKAALVDLVVDAATRHPDLLRRLDRLVNSATGDSAALEKQLRKELDRAIRTRGFINYARARQWAAGVERELDALADMVALGQADIGMRLASHTMTALEKAVETIDDSDGHLGGLIARARRIHRDAALLARPDPVGLARQLFEQEVADAYGFHQSAWSAYADVLGSTGLAEFRRLATEAWDRLPARRGRPRDAIDLGSDYARISAMLDRFAEAEDDLDARIAFRTKDLSSAWRYVELAQVCRSGGRTEQALRYAREGLWVFEDDQPDERLVAIAVDLLTEAGRKVEALEIACKAFESAPSLALYQLLRGLDGTMAIDTAASVLGETSADGRPDLLVQVLIIEQRFDTAWSVVGKNDVTRTTQLSLAKHSERTHPANAVRIYLAHLELLVRLGGKRTTRRQQDCSLGSNHCRPAASIVPM